MWRLPPDSPVSNAARPRGTAPAPALPPRAAAPPSAAGARAPPAAEGPDSAETRGRGRGSDIPADTGAAGKMGQLRLRAAYVGQHC